MFNYKKLQRAEERNKSLSMLYDELKGFNHDFKNIISTIDGYINSNDIIGLEKYIKSIKKDYNIIDTLSVLNPQIINNSGIYGLLNSKYLKATDAGIRFDLYFFLDLNSLEIDFYKFSRILGILLDNAIEEAEKCEEKIIKVSFSREKNNNRSVISIKNTYSDINVDIEKIFEKGISSKQNHSGFGLWEVNKYIKNSKNLDLFTSKTDKYFKQELTIYNIRRKIRLCIQIITVCIILLLYLLLYLIYIIC